MSLYISTKAELIKTKRSASFWLSLLGSGMIPLVFFLSYVIKPWRNYERMAKFPWEQHFMHGWQSFSSFLLPMFVILICSLIPQIEYKNNAWKQVFASPQSIGNIFFSKYIAIFLMIMFLFLMYNIFMILAGVVPNLFLPKYSFLKSSIDWGSLLKLNLRSFIALMGIISIQYWFSLRFRNFIVPIAVGLGLLVTAMVLNSWEHIDKIPYAYPFLTFISAAEPGKPAGGSFMNHEWNSLAYFTVFTLIAFADLRFRKERG